MKSDKELLELVLNKLDEIENHYLNLERKVEEIYKNTKHMEDHINFVEDTYDKVKTPFHYLMDKVSLLSFSPFKKYEITQSQTEKLES